MTRSIFPRSNFPLEHQILLADVIIVVTYIGLVAVVLWLNPFYGEVRIPLPQTQSIEIKPQARDYKVMLGAIQVIYDYGWEWDGSIHGKWSGVFDAGRVPTMNECQKSPPFAMTMSLFHPEVNQRSRLCIIHTDGKFSPDQESQQWHCVRKIQPPCGDDWQNEVEKAGELWTDNDVESPTTLVRSHFMMPPLIDMAFRTCFIPAMTAW